MTTALKEQQPAARALAAGAPPHLPESGELGQVRIQNSVIAVIARLAARQVPGVVEMGGLFVDGLAGIFGRKTSDRGIRVEVEESTVSLELSLVTEYGVRIPELAWRVQAEVRRAVEQMTGHAVREVNVVIQNVRLPAGGKPAGPEENSG